MLAAALLNYADDEGYFNANPKLVQAECCPLREPSVSVQDSITSLSSIGYIQLGTGADGRRYGRVVRFSDHQRVNRPTPSKFSCLDITWDDSPQTHTQFTEPSPPEQGTGNREVEQGKILSNAPRVDDGKVSSRKKRKKAREYDADFLAWWASYPRREQKGDAFDAYWAMRDGGHSVKALQAGAEYAAGKYAEKELEWIPLPATFLRREGFLEAVEEVNGTAGPAPPEGMSVDEKLDWWRDYGEKHAQH